MDPIKRGRIERIAYRVLMAGAILCLVIVAAALLPIPSGATGFTAIDVAAGKGLAALVCTPLGIVLSWSARLAANGYEVRRRWANRLLWCHTILFLGLAVFVAIVVNLR